MTIVVLETWDDINSGIRDTEETQYHGEKLGECAGL